MDEIEDWLMERKREAYTALEILYDADCSGMLREEIRTVCRYIGNLEGYIYGLKGGNHETD